MNKLLSLATALTFAASTFASTAQAGMRVGVGIGVGGLALGALGAMSNGGGRSGEAREYRSRKHERSVRREREEKAPVRAAKKSKSETTQEASKGSDAKEPASTATNESSGITLGKDTPSAPVTTASADTATQTENSSISLASGEVSSVQKVDTAQDTKGLDCKKFFPSVGMTLSVRCE